MKFLQNLEVGVLQYSRKMTCVFPRNTQSLPPLQRGMLPSECRHGCTCQPGCSCSPPGFLMGSGCCRAAETTETAEQLANGDRGFENVELGVIGKKKKIPRRVIHFASGETMEEYSTDEEEDEQEKKDLLPPVDPTTLTWGPYLWFHMLRVATSTLSVCDFLGEKIASVLGISTPKYQYAIDEYYRMKREEEEEEQENKMSEAAERQYQEQQNKPQAEAPVQTDQPEATACTSFVNVNFENEGDCQSAGENKQDTVPVPP